NQKCDGSFSASASKTISSPVKKLFAAWLDARTRRRWLPDAPIQIRRSTPNKSMRVVWNGGPGERGVPIISEGRGASQVALDHEDLPSLGWVAGREGYWRPALERLKVMLES